MFNIKIIMAWLLTVFVMFVLTNPSYSDYMGRAQATEAYSLMNGWKSGMAEFYQDHQRCITDHDIENITDYKGVYVESLTFKAQADGGACYNIATFYNSSVVNRRLRGKSMLLVMIPPTQWPYDVRCQTDIDQGIADCSMVSF